MIHYNSLDLGVLMNKRNTKYFPLENMRQSYNLPSRIEGPTFDIVLING